MSWKMKFVFGAIWQYLNQPIFGEFKAESIWQVQRFWYLYQIQLLENCLKRDINSESHYTQ